MKIEILSKNQIYVQYKRMWPYFKKYSFRLFLGLAITIPMGAMDGVMMLFLRFYTDHIIVAKQMQFVKVIPIAIILFAIVHGVLIYLAAYLNTWVGNKATIDLKKDLYNKLITLDTSYFDVNNSGMVLQRFSSDADLASSTLVNNVRFFLTRFFSSLGLIAVLFYNSWQLALIAVIVLGVAFMPLNMVRKKMKGVVNKSVVVGAEAGTLYNETYHGNKIISAYNLADHQKAKYHTVMDSAFTLAMKMVKYTNWLSPFMYFVFSLGIAGVLYVANILIVQGYITSGNFVSFIGSLIALYTPLKMIGNNYVDIQRSFMAIDRVFEVFSYEPKIKDQSGAMEISSVRKEITYENVGFEYVEGKSVLKDINAKALVGQTIALVGNSGGGKTTFVNLLPRFYDVTKGAIKIDGIDIREITLKSLREKIAVVFQDNFLFSGTIRENIMLGNPEATPEEFKAAVKNAHLGEFLSGLELDADTIIGERGATLSGGQRQRVAIARAFIKNAPIVVLDEATSALDNKSEAVVQKAIDNLMKNRTVFVIAHRLSTVQNADKILVINDGQIVESGTHTELMANNGGAYQTLYNAQFKVKEEVKDTQEAA